MRTIERGQHIITFRELIYELFDADYSDNTTITDLTYWATSIFDVGKENLTMEDWLKLTAIVKTLRHLKAKWRPYYEKKRLSDWGV